MNLRAASIGSINIDYLVDLSELDFADSFFLDGHIMRPIETVVGGNGVFFAEAALEAGFLSSRLFTTVGSLDGLQPDDLASMAISNLRDRGVEVFYSLDKGARTGRVIMTYYPNNRRFVIADRSAGDGFRMDNMPSNIFDLLVDVDLLYVSGYGLQTRPRSDAVQTLMRYARGKGAFVTLDIVPHQVYKSILFEDYKRYIELASAISVEGATILGFLGYANTTIPFNDSIDLLTKTLKGLCELSFIRLNEKSDFLIVSQKESLVVEIPFPKNRAGRRFMDRILARFLKSYLLNGHSIIDVKWISEVQNFKKDVAN